MTIPNQALAHGSTPSTPTGVLRTSPASASTGPRVISLRWIVTLAAVALTTAAVISMGAVAEHNTRQALTQEIDARLLLEARNLALTSGEALLSDFPELTLHPLVKGMKARQPELTLLLVLDHSGIVQGDPDARRLGVEFRPSMTYTAMRSTQALGTGEQMLTDGTTLVASAPVMHTGRRIGTAMVGIQKGYLDHMIATARSQQTMVLLVLVALGIVLASMWMSKLLRPIAALRAGIERIGRGDLDTPVQLTDRTELGLLARAVNRMAGELKQAQAEMVERERLAHEMELARQIQRSLLPAKELRVGEYVVQGSQRAATEVGGDYYDYFELPDGRLGVAVADVSGKGLAGCLVMSMLSALLRALRASYSSPAALLISLDERLSETLQPGSFVTMWYGVLDPRNGELIYASAGHSPVLLYRDATEHTEWLKSTGIPLGAVRGGAIKATVKDATITLGAGDLIVQYTDGINEAFDPTGENQFGFDRMAHVVVDTAAKGCGAIIESLHASVEKWTGGGIPFDDETVLVVSHEGEGAPALRPEIPGRYLEAEPTPQKAMADAESRGSKVVLNASLDSMVRIYSWLTDMFPQEHLTAKDFELLSTALYEACANIAEHGYGQDKQKEFALWWVPPESRAAVDDWLQKASGLRESSTLREGFFVIHDHGKPFSADNWTRPEYNDPAVRSKGRGIGLDIIHRAMRKVSYHPGTSMGNVTLMYFGPAYGFNELSEVRNG